MKGYFVLVFIILALMGSCGTNPESGSPPETGAAAETSPPPAAETDDNTAAFDPGSISQELFDSTKIEVQRLIEELNGIIQNKDYDSWVSYLGGEYFADITSPDYLETISNSAALKSQKIVVKTPQDYFHHVVVPSRANSRVDDIEFITQKRVKAFTINDKGQRLRLYDLEKTPSGWKILN
jgi:hypothetical protein